MREIVAFVRKHAGEIANRPAAIEGDEQRKLMANGFLNATDPTTLTQAEVWLEKFRASFPALKGISIHETV